jgi:SAM-dependent methyltransferase
MQDRDRRAPESVPSVDELRAQPIGAIERWRWLWEGDHRFPARSHRRFLGPLLRLAKAVLRPLVETPLREQLERQRLFNLALLAELERLRVDELWQTTYAVSQRTDERFAAQLEVNAAHEQGFAERDRRHLAMESRALSHEQKFEAIDLVFRRYEDRVGHLEKVYAQGLKDVMRHNDALFALVDQKLDRYRQEGRELLSLLQSALSAARASASEQASPGEPVAGGGGAPAVAADAAPTRGVAAGSPATMVLQQALAEGRYLELERRHRGTEGEIAERLAPYLPRLAGRRRVLDLGCGRGEALALLAAAGHEASGIDASAEMVAHCRARGLSATQGDLFAALAALPAESLDAVVSFHVIEHLPAELLEELVSLAWNVLRPGGMLVLETPNPLSLTVAASRFWLDPTHRRPVHPESLRLACELAGFSPVEVQFLRPFPPQETLPEIPLAGLPTEQHELADRINRLRDRLDAALFGAQDYAVLAERPTAR